MTRKTSNDAFSRLGFPEVWRTFDLYSDEMRLAHEADLANDPPGADYRGDHHRYGAFCFWLGNSETPESTLRALITAASADPDHAMAQAALIDLVAHPNCTASLYEQALAAFRGFAEQYFDAQDFGRAYREKKPSWKLRE